MDSVPSVSVAVGSQDVDEYDSLDPELDNLIATVTFNETTGEASDHQSRWDWQAEYTDMLASSPASISASSTSAGLQ
ncbi:hypothetical protein EIP86_009771 [Pleurotus ostreatoroseus]|nr:hypothetical protein EIP86_009771 [Pleurotus ostreatoroseus]